MTPTTNQAPDWRETLKRLRAEALSLTLKHGSPNGTDYEQGVNDHGYRWINQLDAALSSASIPAGNEGFSPSQDPAPGAGGSGVAETCHQPTSLPKRAGETIPSSHVNATGVAPTTGDLPGGAAPTHLGSDPIGGERDDGWNDAARLQSAIYKEFDKRVAELLRLLMDVLALPLDPEVNGAISEALEVIPKLQASAEAGWAQSDGWMDLHDKAQAALSALPEGVGGRDNRQASVAKWCADAFGAEHQASIPQRGLRHAEEAIEAAQAAGCDRDQVRSLVDYIFDRPVGKLRQELGGSGLTLLALAAAAGESADAAEADELARVLSKPLAWFHARNQVKNDAGFDALAYPSAAPIPPVGGSGT